MRWSDPTCHATGCDRDGGSAHHTTASGTSDPADRHTACATGISTPRYAIVSGAGRVVTRRSETALRCRAGPDPDYAVVGGNPAVHIKDRYSESEVAALVQIAWWDWPISVVTEHLRTIAAGTVEQLQEIADRLG